MNREHPGVTFERYVDDVVVHANSQRHAEQLRASVAARMVEVGLELHPDKTRVVYCRDDRRRGAHRHISFIFLGYEFRPRMAKARNGRTFFSFLPAVSRPALTAMSRRVRSWRIHRQTGASADDLARWMNPIIRGWMNYYGRFRRSALSPLLLRVNTYLARWAQRKYKGLRAHKRLRAWWERFVAANPTGFTGNGCATTCCQDEKSRVRGDSRFRGSRGVKLPPATRPLKGVGPDVASTLLLAACDNPERLTNERSFASLCGVSPVQASSGKTQRHRLNRGGDRQANAAMWRIALVRLNCGDRQANAAMWRIALVRLNCDQRTKDYPAKPGSTVRLLGIVKLA